MTAHTGITTPPIFEARTFAVVSALIVHQVFRRYESFSPFFQFSLILLPPSLVTAFVTTQAPSTWTVRSVFSLVFPTYLAALVASTIVYRLSPFHPLARYPGPIGARVSKFWMAVRCLRGDQHRYIQSLHQRYGDVVRTGPNELSIRDATVIPSALGPSGLRKGPHFVGRLLKADALTLVALQDTEEHLQRRRPWIRGFSPSALKDYEHRIAYRVGLLREGLAREEGVVLLDQWFNYFSYDFMSDMAFGGGSELLRGEREDDFWSVLEANMRTSTFLGHVPWLAVLLGHIPAAVAPLKALISKCETLVRLRIEHGSSTPDLFHYLNGEDDPARAPPLAQLVDDGILTIVAGADTTASALTSLFVCLLAHPDAYARLEAEVDRFYPPGEDACSTAHHKEMPFLNAAINETLRLFPPVPGCTQREEPSSGRGTTIGSIYIPPGTSFWVHAYSIHRDPRNFSPHPDRFWPERWLLAASAPGGAGAPPDFKHDEGAFIAFSHGPMNCVGRALALQEIRTVVCALVQRFRVARAGAGGLRAYEGAYKDFFVSGRPGLPVVLEGREGRVGS